MAEHSCFAYMIGRSGVNGRCVRVAIWGLDVVKLQVIGLRMNLSFD